nr:variable surface lipoprotein [Mycoplasmopsis bovis]
MKRKLMLIGGGLVFASSFPMIAASCENKNPTDESIVNNTTPQTQGNQKSKDKKKKAKNTNGSGNSSSDTAPQTQGNQNRAKDKSKDIVLKRWP